MTPQAEPSRPTAQRKPVEPEGPTVLVAYRGMRPVALRGMATRRVYTFSPARRTRAVAARDASVLLASALFEEATR